MLVTRHFCAQTASDFSTQLTTLARPEHNHVIQRKRSFNFLPSFTLSPLSQSVLQKQKDNRKNGESSGLCKRCFYCWCLVHRRSLQKRRVFLLQCGLLWGLFSRADIIYHAVQYIAWVWALFSDMAFCLLLSKADVMLSPNLQYY